MLRLFVSGVPPFLWINLRRSENCSKPKGWKIDILKLGDSGWSDEEIDYAFNVCKTLGAKGITMEISEEAAKRMVPFTEKHNLYVIFHNHGQPGNPNFSFDKVLAYGPKLMLNFDAGPLFWSYRLKSLPVNRKTS